MLAKSAEVEVPINAAQKVRARYVVIKVERIEELVLHATLMTHHDESLPPIDAFQDSEHSKPRATFSTESADRHLMQSAYKRTYTQGLDRQRATRSGHSA